MKKKIIGVALAGSLLIGVPANAEMNYKDVRPTAQYYDAVKQLVEIRAVSPTLEYFHPGSDVTRGQAAKILVTAFGLDIANVENPNFKDVPKTHQFYPYIAALQNAGIIVGYPDGTYGVNKSLTRGHMAKMLVDGFDLDKLSTIDVMPFTDAKRFEGFGEYIFTLYKKGIVSGYSPTTYGTNKPITRAQLAMMLKKMMDKLPALQSEVKLHVPNSTSPFIRDESIIKITDKLNDHIEGAIIEEIYFQQGIKSKNKEDYIPTLTLQPLKEGKTVLHVDDYYNRFPDRYYMIDVVKNGDMFDTTLSLVKADIPSEYKSTVGMNLGISQITNLMNETGSGTDNVVITKGRYGYQILSLYDDNIYSFSYEGTHYFTKLTELYDRYEPIRYTPTNRVLIEADKLAETTQYEQYEKVEVDGTSYIELTEPGTYTFTDHSTIYNYYVIKVNDKYGVSVIRDFAFERLPATYINEAHKVENEELFEGYFMTGKINRIFVSFLSDSFDIIRTKGGYIVSHNNGNKFTCEDITFETDDSGISYYKLVGCSDSSKENMSIFPIY